MPPARLKAFIEKFTEEVWHQGNLDAVDDYVAANFVSYDPVNPTVEGPEGFKQFVASVRTAYPDIHFTLDDLISERDKVIGRWTCRGTHLGRSPTLGLDPTGRPVEFAGVTIYQIDNNKIVADWEIWDRLSLLQQLGVIPLAAMSAT